MTTEAQLQTQVISLAKLYGWWCYHTRYAIGSTAGYPDLTLIHPEHGVAWAELKSMTGRLSKAQEQCRDLLLAAGCRWFLWRPSDLEHEVLTVLRGGR